MEEGREREREERREPSVTGISMSQAGRHGPQPWEDSKSWDSVVIVFPTTRARMFPSRNTVPLVYKTGPSITVSEPRPAPNNS